VIKDGSGEEELLMSSSNGMLQAWSWADDGKTLVLQEITQNPPGFNIGIAHMEGDWKWEPLLQEEHEERQPQVSPDGKWLAYTSDEEGKLEVYIRPFPEVGRAKQKVSTDGGNNPLWSTNGDVLYYRDQDAIMAVTVESDPDLKLGNPSMLFRGPYDTSESNVGASWNIHPDGKRFLMMKQASTAEDGSELVFRKKINIVLNWFEELEERVPVD